jgi:DNA-binding NarL/FixJ family response regulator
VSRAERTPEGHGKRPKSRKTIEAHVSQIFLKLDLRESHDQNRRVLAVLAFLRSG